MVFYATNSVLSTAKSNGSIGKAEMTLSFDQTKGDNLYSDVKQNILMAIPRRTGGTGGSFSHEISHGVGNEHPITNDGSITSYSQNRQLKPYEIVNAL